MKKRRFRDAELISTELFVKDPYALGGLDLARLPEGVQIVEVINMHRYERYPAEKAFCCACGACRHKHGYRVRCSDDRETLLGSCCAKPILGRSWLKAEKDWKQNTERQGYLKELHALGPVALRTMPQLVTWQQLAWSLRKAQTRFHSAMPEVYELLQQAANSSGELLASERIRKLKWQSSKGRHDDADEKEDYYWEYIPVRHILAGRMFLRRGNPLDVPNAVKDAIRALSDVTSDTDKQPTSALKKACTGLRRSLDELRTLSEMRVAALEFFGPDNLAGIERWARLLRSGHDQQLPYDVVVQGDALINLKSRLQMSTPELPVPDHELFDILTYRKTA